MGFQDWWERQLGFSKEDNSDGYDEEDGEDFDAPIQKPVKKKKSKKNESIEEESGDYEEEFDGPTIVHQFGKKNGSEKGVKNNTMEESKQAEVRIIAPTSYDDAKEIVEALHNRICVVLKLEDLDFELAVRILDFTIGACYAMGGSIQKISMRIFVVTPNAVKLSGEDLTAFGEYTDFSSLDLNM